MEKLKINKTIIVFALLFLAIVVLVVRSEGTYGETCISDSEMQFRILDDISAEESLAMIQARTGEPDFVILDVRTQEEYESGYIEGAINIDYYSETYRDDLDTLDKEKAYLIYCRTARRTGETMDIMRELGFREVYNMLGGINEWEAEGFTITKK